MPWWKRNPAQLTASSSSSSAAASPSRASAGGRCLPRDLSFFPRSRRQPQPQPQPRLTRQNNLRRLTDSEIEVLCSDVNEAHVTRSAAVNVTSPPCNLLTVNAASSNHVYGSAGHLDAISLQSPSAPMRMPCPLPLPESAATASPRRELALGQGFEYFPPPNSVGCALPSFLGRLGGKEGDGRDGAASELRYLEPGEERCFYQTDCRSPEQVGILLNKSTISECRTRKVLQEPNSVGTTAFMLNIPDESLLDSEFVSPLSSPVCSPTRERDANLLAAAVGSYRQQEWLTTEVPSTGRMAILCSSSVRAIRSPERSPLCSPGAKATIIRSRNATVPSSPSHQRMFSENVVALHDNASTVNVYPLPLPPGDASSVQLAFSHQGASKIEVSLLTNQWQKGKLIGSGTFGNVYEGTNIHNGALCAMKEVSIIPDDPRSAECLKQLEQEIKFLSQFKHPNIVQYYGSETIEDRLYIYLEYVHPGSINKYVHQYCGAMTEAVVRNFTRHILKGLIYLHSKKVMHRDIKGANLLVDVNGVVKLADFGTAKHLSGAAAVHSMKGSPFWMAPEMLQADMNKETSYGLAVDIWSLGCTIIEMFTGKHPWSGLQGHHAMFKVLHYDPPIPEGLSHEGKEFLKCCFRRNPAERPTASMLLEHPFLQNSQSSHFYGSVHTTGIAPTDNDSRSGDREGDREESRSCLFVNWKHKSNENNQSHPETVELAPSRISFRSTPKVFPRQSPLRSSLAPTCSAGSSANVQNGVQSGNGNLQPYNFPNRTGRETQVITDMECLCILHG